METYWERLTERVSLLTPFLIEPTREHEKKRKKRRSIISIVRAPLFITVFF